MFDLNDPEIIDRFWSKVRVRGEKECWPWLKGKDGCGYGHFKYKNRNYKAHIVSFAINIGIWPTGLIIRHSCNNPPCVNPAHLIDGTNKENTQDSIKAGTHKIPDNRGEKHGNTILTENNVKRIRYLGIFFNSRQISKMNEFKDKIGYDAIHDIINYNTWKHLE